MKRGLVLEGGGAKGAFHCGVVMALYDNGYTFDGVAGTSIGAINAALIVQDKNYDSMFRLWSSVTASLFTDLDDEQVENLFNKEYSKSTVVYWSKQVIKFIRNLGIPTDKLIPFLKEYISEEKVRNSDMDLAMVTYSITDRAPVELFLEDIPIGELHNFIMASAYYPAFRLKPLNGKYYVDGGIYNNMPIALLAQKDYDEIIAVRTMSKMPYKLPQGNNVKIDFICPSEDLGKTVALSQKMVSRNIKLGYFDALKFLKGYGGYRYYLDGSTDEMIDLIYAAVRKNYKILADVFKMPNDSSVEAVIKELRSEVLKLYDEFTVNCDAALIMLFEEYAKLFEMEKFKLYTPISFWDELKSHSADYSESGSRFNLFMREKIRKDKIFYSVISDNNE